ncbi:MAG TPA: tryptophan synthase subunit alpha [Candidatus Thermoplasmatota archaeon]|nr:tryptophan synthase subunit alpha [Candidatus Thermoplasmatota archaeon]
MKGQGAARLRAALSAPGPHLIAYVMAGDPSLDATAAHVRALAKAGASVIELGVPFSDPIADGPTIQQAATRALAAGTRPSDVLQLVRGLRADVRVPIALMTYYNLIHKAGVAEWVREATRAGVDGVIVPDLPVEEAGVLLGQAGPAGMGTIFLASPATSDERLDRIAAASSGFLYLVSMYGVTGARDKLPDYTLQLVQRVKKRTAGKVPLAVGFGVSQKAHVQDLARAGADAVVVGSAIVDRIAKGASPADVGRFVAGLRP